jgi:hypothetical protein
MARSIEFGFAVLLTCLQELIGRQWHEAHFEETVTGSKDEWGVLYTPYDGGTAFGARQLDARLMGTIAHLCVDDYPLIETKNELDPVVLTVFRESDRRTYTRRIRDRSPLIYSRVDSDEEEQVIEYATTVA